MTSDVYELRTVADFVVCQYVDLEMLERHLKTKYQHLTNYKIVKVTKKEEIICEITRSIETGTTGKSVQQVPAVPSPDEDLSRC